MKQLALFFTFNMSVEKWKRSGLLDREKIIYEEHIKRDHLDRIYWFTYGTRDKKYSARLPEEIEIIHMPKIFNFALGRLIYSFLMPFLYPGILKQCVLKTNQMSGSWTAIIARMLYKRPLILRTGWTWSLFTREKNRKWYSFLIRILERLAYYKCDVAAVTSNFQKDHIIHAYKINKKKIEVIPNYIDLDIFKKRKEIHARKNVLLFIGRLEKQKNLFNLIYAVSKVKFPLVIYGKGSLKKELVDIAKSSKALVFFRESIPNDKLPEIYNQYKYFILPSFYEGMPKVLIEAMACGCVCIGCNVQGVREIIKNRYNGFLMENTRREAIYKGLKTVMGTSQKILQQYSDHACLTVKDYGLESVVTKENALIKRFIR
ncbi:MAG: glycosyltransferase family 4 protein [Spirochaetes bacterium]|nr:glycosyltransferase family 4 protein [Spirochaetota bacterium]